ncbi:MAG: glycosyltransferase family 2 protein [Chloroflexi bacterium]|nr:glycosyltransferase family 2 protein [Chloroflexota bacterium]MCI0576092.1 glycosyltransferase family 2 protein [Chloroflexota bacterium]MCI0647880.1 glycosyltransferase family 2 protein [Chloroflexota bacterium]MCI0727131.1 glycosyltransferase family 2 protein [Chloroflexota bacterium]
MNAALVFTAGARPELSIIIVSWNVRELLRACLRSVEAGRGGLEVEVIVVDGGSTDGSPEMVQSEFPWVRLMARPENVGFPRGNNIGLREAGGRYLLLLNPDTEIMGDALITLCRFLEENPDVGLVGPQLVNPDGTAQSSRRRFPTLATAVFESTWLQPWAPAGLLRRYYAQDLPDEATADVDWLMGACLMVRREVVEQVGLMDEAYFMYSEELDWCRRIKMAGWRVVYRPAARVLHHQGKSSDQVVTARHIYFQQAKLRYFRKYHGRAAALFLRLFLLFSYGWQLGLEAAKGVLGHKRPLRWQRVEAYWQVIRSGLRPAGY